MKASQKFALDHRLIWSKASCTTGGNHRSDYIEARALFGSLPNVEWRLGDRGWDADWFRDTLKDTEIRACIPRRRQRKATIKYDKRRHKHRNRIKIMFGRLKDWRAVAARYDRCPKVVPSAITLGTRYLRATGPVSSTKWTTRVGLVRRAL